jgi:hypothetical protein
MILKACLEREAVERLKVENSAGQLGSWAAGQMGRWADGQHLPFSNFQIAKFHSHISTFKNLCVFALCIPPLTSVVK